MPYIFNIAYIMYSNKLYIQLHFGSLMKSAVFPHVQLKYVSWGKELTFGFCVCHPINIMYVRQDFSCWKTGLESFRFQPSPLITLFTKVQQHKNRNLKDKHTVFLVRIRRRQTYSPMALYNGSFSLAFMRNMSRGAWDYENMFRKMHTFKLKCWSPAPEFIQKMWKRVWSS